MENLAFRTRLETDGYVTFEIMFLVSPAGSGIGCHVALSQGALESGIVVRVS